MRGKALARYFFWPVIESTEEALKLAKRGAYAVWIQSASYLSLLVWHLSSHKSIFAGHPDMDPTTVFVAASVDILFIFICLISGIFLYRGSRVASIIALLILLLEISAKAHHASSLLAAFTIPLIIILFIIQGVRGAFAIQTFLPCFRFPIFPSQ